MEELKKYKFRLRQKYGTTDLLVEFIGGVENKNFGVDLFDSLKDINPKLFSHQDLWMDDEVLYLVNSDIGQFTLSRNIWNLAFIMSDDSQGCIAQIDNLLVNDNRFEKIEVDENNFKS